MRILRAEIYGFGKWVDQSFDFTESSFNSIYGKNESGKSTLQQFFLYMLFGLRPAQLNHFKPQTSNKTGGKLTVKDEVSGEFVIERVGRNVTIILASGEIKDEEWLREKLHGLTRAVYTSIYTFSAIDLEKIKHMKEEALSEVLFSVGLTGATEIFKLEKDLQTKMDTMYKQRGSKPQINQQLMRLKEMRAKVETFKNNEAMYGNKITKREEIKQALSNDSSEQEVVRREIAVLEKIIQMEGQITAYYEIEENLRHLPENIQFPEDGLNRYRVEQEGLRPLVSERKVLGERQVLLIQKQEQLAASLLNPETLEQGKRLLTEKDKMQQHLLERKQREDALLVIEKELREKLLEIELDEAYVMDVSLPFHLEENWQAMTKAADTLKGEQARMDEETALLSYDKGRKIEERDELQSKMIAQTQCQENERKINQYEHGKMQEQNENEQQKQFMNWQAAREKTSKKVLSIMIGLSLLLTVLSFFFYPLALRAAGMLTCVLGIALFYKDKQAGKQLARLRVPTVTTDNGLLTVDEYETLKAIMQKQTHLQTKLNDCHYGLQQIDARMLTWQDKADIYNQRRASLKQQITNEQGKYSFLQGLNVTHWLGFLSLLREAKEQLAEKQQVRKKYESHQTEINGLDHALQSFARTIGSKEERYTFAMLEDELFKTEHRQDALQEIVREAAENQQKIGRLEQQIQLYEREIERLFEHAAVSSYEEYVVRSQQVDNHQQLTRRKEQFISQLNVMFDAEIKAAIIGRTLHLSEVTYQLEGLTMQASELLETIKKLQTDLATIDVEIGLMESSEAYSEAVFRLEVEKENLNKAAKEWATLRVIQTVIQNAKKSYQEKYLSDVMEVTSNYFEKLTNGKYLKVIAPEGKRLFQVETAKFGRFNVNELSQGTIDQLYISLRLALSKVMQSKFPVPIIIDDAFVHFDNMRMEQGIDLIKEIAAEQQVFFFTCHKHIADSVDAVLI